VSASDVSPEPPSLLGPGDRWQVRLTGDGTPTLVHPGHGQACHSDHGAWEEACTRYAEACRLSEHASSMPLVRVLDIGTGPGWNLAAALHAVESAGSRLEVHTFELDPTVLREAVARFGDHPYAEQHAPVREALAAALEGTPHVALGERSRLHLHLGDARETLVRLPEEPVFDAVFLDPFSPRVAPELWSPHFLAQLARRMAPGSFLSTYSTSLEVSAALHAAGLRVGRGPRVGRKSGCLASPDRTPPELPERTQRRIERRARALSR